MGGGGAGRGVALVLASCALACAGPASPAGAAKAAGGKGSKGTRPAPSKAGRLDRSFSGDGKLVAVLPTGTSPYGSATYRLPLEYTGGRIVMAAAGGGKLVVASNKAIVEYLANGRPNPSFGGNGAVPIGGVGGVRFRLADIAVDSQGRLVVAGTSRPDNELGMGGPPVAGPVPSTATIRRYLPNGQLDSTFGAEGVLKTDFGAQPPTFEGKAYPEAAVGVVGIAVDRADRPVVTGSLVAEVGLCTPSKDRFQRSQAFVARLQANGAPDPSFAGSGIKAIGGLAWLGLPARTGSGVLAVGAKVDPCPQGGEPEAPSVLTSLAGDGSLSQGFSAGGFWSQPFIRISDLAVASSGKIALLARTMELKHGKWVESAGEAIRLRRNGSFDTGFGRGGRDEVELPKQSSLAAIAIDRKGRVLLAGTVPRARRDKRRSQQRFLLIRTTPAGEADAAFGRGGKATTAFGSRSNVFASDVLIDPAGRIVVGGRFSGPSTGSGFALARYLGGK
jgi:uncharacterized delta-60 repeat protein